MQHVCTGITRDVCETVHEQPGVPHAQDGSPPLHEQPGDPQLQPPHEQPGAPHEHAGVIEIGIEQHV